MTYTPVDLIEVRAWGRLVGALQPAIRGSYVFEYDDGWIRTGADLAPALLPRRRQRFVFPELSHDTYRGLPPTINDSLPDAFGNSIINSWLQREGIPRERITALDRLAYLGPRGMGALEYVPDIAPHLPPPTALDLSDLIVTARAAVEGSLATEQESEQALRRIIEVGTSAGGARAKAIVNLDPTTMEIRSGHLPPTTGFEAWLLKFDGIGQDLDLGSTRDYGRIEYAYSLMARAAGIDMAETRLLEENGRAHFMTKRFDRVKAARVHMQSLCALDAVDFNLIGVNDYAQYLGAVDKLALGQEALSQAWRRMAFNVIASNCDDHSKNFAFLLPENGEWQLAPAYDVTHAHSPGSRWTSQHLMSVNGRFSDISRGDMMAVADRFGVHGVSRMLGEIQDAVASWPAFASQAGLPAAITDEIGSDFELGGS